MIFQWYQSKKEESPGEMDFFLNFPGVTNYFLQNNQPPIWLKMEAEVTIFVYLQYLCILPFQTLEFVEVNKYGSFVVMP